MYTPPKFAADTDRAWAIVAEAGAGMLVRTGATQLLSVFVPVVVTDDRTVLRSHLAKGNGWWRDAEDGSEVLALFVAASAYVSPSYYPSRLEGAQHVPTWNYVAAEVRGRLRLHHDAQWLRDQTREVTEHFEAGRTPEWRVEETSDEYVEQQLKAIVGIEIDVLSIEGKVKLSQNRLDVDRDEVRRQLARGTLPEQSVADWMDRA